MTHAMKDDVRALAQKRADEIGESQYFFPSPMTSDDWYFTSKLCPAFHRSEYSETIEPKDRQ